jgi:hypothetical protein
MAIDPLRPSGAIRGSQMSTFRGSQTPALRACFSGKEGRLGCPQPLAAMLLCIARDLRNPSTLPYNPSTISHNPSTFPHNPSNIRDHHLPGDASRMAPIGQTRQCINTDQ